MATKRDKQIGIKANKPNRKTPSKTKAGMQKVRSDRHLSNKKSGNGAMGNEPVRMCGK